MARKSDDRQGPGEGRTQAPDAQAGSRPGRDASRALRVLALIAVAAGLAGLTAAACVLSYSSIHDLAIQAGVHGRLASIYPYIFDAMLVVAGCSVLALRGAGLISRIYSWLCMLVLLAALGRRRRDPGGRCCGTAQAGRRGRRDRAVGARTDRVRPAACAPQVRQAAAARQAQRRPRRRERPGDARSCGSQSCGGRSCGGKPSGDRSAGEESGVSRSGGGWPYRGQPSGRRADGHRSARVGARPRTRARSAAGTGPRTSATAADDRCR